MSNLHAPSAGTGVEHESAGPRLRALRQAKGKSLAQTAAEAGVTKGFLSLAERGKTRVSVPTLLRLCDVLDVQIGALFNYPAEPIVHGGMQIDMGGNDIEEFMLTPSGEQHLQAMRSVIQPGGGSDGIYSLDAESIFVLVLCGRIDLTVDGEVRSLDAGDSTTFGARSHHGFVNPDQTVAEVVWVITPPMRNGAQRLSSSPSA